MKNLRLGFYAIAILFSVIILNACKAKKVVAAPAPPAPVVTPPPPPAPAPKPVQTQTPPPLPPPAEKPNYNFTNIQFEFNSGVLKTDSYPILDKAAVEMKKDPSAKFILSGYASAEGTVDHNISLSADRANAVKLYLVNSGINGDNLSTKGFGEANPVADNSTDAGKVLNRRVEIKKQN